MVRALPCHGRGCGFEPRRLRKIFLFRSLLISFGLILAPSCRAVVLAKEETLVKADRPNQMSAVGPFCQHRIGKSRPVGRTGPI